MAHVRVPHISLPFRFVPYVDQRGELRYEAAVNSQGSDAEVADCIEAILRYPVGYRLERPEFGTPDQLFKAPGPDSAEIRRSVEEWEPRTIVAVATAMERFDELVDDVYVDYKRREG